MLPIGQKRQEHWNTLLKARAIENQSFVIACNRVGIDFKNITYREAPVINAVGTVMSKESKKEELIVTTIDKSDLNEIRGQLPFLRDR